MKTFSNAPTSSCEAAAGRDASSRHLQAGSTSLSLLTKTQLDKHGKTLAACLNPSNINQLLQESHFTAEHLMTHFTSLPKQMQILTVLTSVQALMMI